MGVLLAIGVSGVFSRRFVPNLRPNAKADLAIKAAEAAQKAAQRTAEAVRYRELQAEFESLGKQFEDFSKQVDRGNYANVDGAVVVVKRQLVVGAEMDQILQTNDTDATPEDLAAWNRAWRNIKTSGDEFLTLAAKVNEDVKAENEAREATREADRLEADGKRLVAEKRLGEATVLFERARLARQRGR